MGSKLKNVRDRVTGSKQFQKAKSKFNTAKDKIAASKAFQKVKAKVGWCTAADIDASISPYKLFLPAGQRRFQQLERKDRRSKANAPIGN